MSEPKNSKVIPERVIIAVDFDGTCVAHSFPLIGENIGAEDVLKELVDKGHKLILYTMRSNRKEPCEPNDKTILNVTGNFLDHAIEWFKRHQIPLYGIQTNPSQCNWTTSPKCYAELYIDDAALGCPLKYDFLISERPFVDWVKVRELLKLQGLL